MSDRFLWTGTGRPDPFVLRLQRELAPVRERVQAAGRLTGAVCGFVRVGTVVIAAAAAALLVAWLAGGSAQAAQNGVARGVPASALAPFAIAEPALRTPPTEPDEGMGPAGATR